MPGVFFCCLQIILEVGVFTACNGAAVFFRAGAGGQRAAAGARVGADAAAAYGGDGAVGSFGHNGFKGVFVFIYAAYGGDNKSGAGGAAGGAGGDGEIFSAVVGGAARHFGDFHIQHVERSGPGVFLQAVSFRGVADRAHQRKRFGGAGFFHGRRILGQGHGGQDADNQHYH